jgi:hypothetical protein
MLNASDRQRAEGQQSGRHRAKLLAEHKRIFSRGSLIGHRALGHGLDCTRRQTPCSLL